MCPDPERRRGRAGVRQPVGHHQPRVVDGVRHLGVDDERVPVLRVDGGAQGDSIVALLDRPVGGVPQQAVTGGVVTDIGDVQLLLRAAQRPHSPGDPVRPRHQHDSAAHGGQRTVVPGFGERHAADTELAKDRGDLADPRRHPTTADGELVAADGPGRRHRGFPDWPAALDSARPNCSSLSIWANPPSVTDLEKR